MRLAAVAIERDGAGTQRDRERGRERRRDGEQCEYRVGNYSTMNIN